VSALAALAASKAAEDSAAAPAKVQLNVIAVAHPDETCAELIFDVGLQA
jgi:hypothetical protein